MYNIQVHVPYEKRQYIKKMNHYITTTILYDAHNGVLLLQLFILGKRKTGKLLVSKVPCSHSKQCEEKNGDYVSNNNNNNNRYLERLTLTGPKCLHILEF